LQEEHLKQSVVEAANVLTQVADVASKMSNGRTSLSN
jgi:hypothetical protein